MPCRHFSYLYRADGTGRRKACPVFFFLFEPQSAYQKISEADKIDPEAYEKSGQKIGYRLGKGQSAQLQTAGNAVSKNHAAEINHIAKGRKSHTFFHNTSSFWGGFCVDFFFLTVLYRSIRPKNRTATDFFRTFVPNCCLFLIEKGNSAARKSQKKRKSVKNLLTRTAECGII